MNIVPIRAQHTMTHARVAGKISNGNPLEPQRPGGEQMKSAVPGKIIDPGGGFEKDNRRARRSWRLADDTLCHTRDFQIVEPADKSAFEALSEEVLEHGSC